MAIQHHCMVNVQVVAVATALNANCKHAHHWQAVSFSGLVTQLPGIKHHCQSEAKDACFIGTQAVGSSWSNAGQV